MFFKEIQKFTIVSKPKGGNQAPSIRIRCRLIFHVFWSSYEKHFSIKMTFFRWSHTLSPVWRTRREEIKHPLSESAFDTFFVFSRQLMKMFFYQNDTFFMQIQEFTIVSNPKGGNQAPSIRIRGRRCKTQKWLNTEPQASQKLSLKLLGSKLRRASFEGIGV